MSDFSSLLKYEEIKQQIHELLQISQKKLMDIIIISQTLKWAAVFGLFWGRFIHLFGNEPQRSSAQIFFMLIRSHFVTDFSFCFKDVFFGSFNYSEENIRKYNFNLCFLLAKFHIHKQKSVSKSLFSLFKVDLDEYIVTIQSSVHPTAEKTSSLYSYMCS